MTEYAFPDGFAEIYKDYFRNNLTLPDGGPVRSIVGRPTRPEDPNFTVGVQPEEWNEDGYEIGNASPLINRYQLDIWQFSKHANEEIGRGHHSRFARNLRRMVVLDSTLRSTLHSTTDTYESSVERPTKIRPRRQKFFSNQVGSSWLFLAVMTIEIETEISQ